MISNYNTRAQSTLDGHYPVQDESKLLICLSGLPSQTEHSIQPEATSYFQLTEASYIQSFASTPTFYTVGKYSMPSNQYIAMIEGYNQQLRTLYSLTTKNDALALPVVRAWMDITYPQRDSVFGIMNLWTIKLRTLVFVMDLESKLSLSPGSIDNTRIDDDADVTKMIFENSEVRDWCRACKDQRDLDVATMIKICSNEKGMGRKISKVVTKWITEGR